MLDRASVRQLYTRREEVYLFGTGTQGAGSGEVCRLPGSYYAVLIGLRRKIRRYESLLETIKRAWDIYVPQKSLEDALKSLDGVEGVEPPSVPASTDPVRPWSAHTSAPSTHAVRYVESPVSPESQNDPEPLNPEDFEFDESAEYGDAIDGMGFLTVDSYKSGYTGPQSGIAALNVLRSLPTTYALDANNGATLDSMYSAASLDDHASTDVLIGDYFRIFHPAYPLLHEGSFRARASGALPKPKDGSWPLLYNMVLAIGAWSRDTEGSDNDLTYFRIAREGLSLSVIEKGSMTYVQGLTLMANYLQKRNKPNAGFALVGIAWSMGMAIGLHREFGPSGTTPFAMELRRRTWWCLYLFVSGAQLTLGRPPASLIGINLRLPANVDDSSLAVDMDALPVPKERPTAASCILAQIPLAKIANDVQSELLTNHVPTIEVADHLDRRIETWESSLPAYLKPDHQMPSLFELPKRALLWRSYHLRVVLNRPFLFHAISERKDISTTDPRVQRCISAADICVESVHRSVLTTATLQRGHAWYATYWLISASFVHAICVACAPNANLAGAWVLRIRQAIEALERMGFAHTMARRAQRILQNIYGQCKASVRKQNER